MITSGFGIEYDPRRGVSRAWVYKDGVKRWTDTGEPVEPPKIDIETKMNDYQPTLPSADLPPPTHGRLVK